MTQRQRLMLKRHDAPQMASRASWRNSQTGISQSDRADDCSGACRQSQERTSHTSSWGVFFREDILHEPDA